MATQRPRQPIERNLAMELARVTEAAAMAAVRHMGMGDKELVDQAAVDAMRYTLGYVSMDGIVVIGEGEKDEAPMLYNGERIGSGTPPEVDIAVDPIDGTTLLSKGLPGAIAVVALSARGTMNVPGNVFYMNKIAVGPDAIDAIDIEAGVTDNLRQRGGGQGGQRPRPDGGDAGPTSTRGDPGGGPRGRRARQDDLGRRHRRGHPGGAAGLRRRHAAGHRRVARRRC